MCWPNVVAFIKNDGSCKKIKRKKIKEKKTTTKKGKSETTPFPPPILLCGMNRHCF